MRLGLSTAVLCLVMVLAVPVLADIDHYGGTYTGWPTTWTPLNGLNDPDDGVADQLDFVGDSLDPAGYFAWDNNYVYFRMRVAADEVTASTYSDSLFILVDLPNYVYPVAGNVEGHWDYAFAWDSNSGDPTRHGVELQIPSTISTTWATSRNADLDGNSGLKIAPPDFNDNGDALLRSVDGISTTNFGLTSYIDWAISFDHLETYTELGRGQTWIVQFASIADSNDHGTLDTDIAGGNAPGDPIVDNPGDSATTPEPGTLALLALGLTGIGAWRRRRAT